MDTKNFIVKKPAAFFAINRTKLVILLLITLTISMSGCLTEPTDDQDVVITAYQQLIAEKGPQQRPGWTGLDSLKPPTEPNAPALDITIDQASGKKLINLTQVPQ